MKLIKFATLILLSIISLAVRAQQQQPEVLNLFDRWIDWSDGKNMLVHHLNSQAFSYLDKRDAEINSLASKEDWIARQKKVRQAIAKITGEFPAKTNLNPKVTGIVQKPGFRVEKIVFESMPRYYVTGCLFIPEGSGKKTDKKPAILFTSGHNDDAFRNKSYQTMILNLVKKGFIVFAIDPAGQGERLQYFNPQKNASSIGGPTTEHSYFGNQCFMIGVSSARYFIWDGIRAVDYLLTRKEVDPNRIGVSGQSGGGTQSAYIFASDERIKAGAPVNYVTGFRRLLESIGPQDAEQNMIGAISNGITHADFLEVRAPNPSMIVAGTRDFFSIQGARETYNEVKKAYSAFGAEQNASFIEDDFAHGYTPKLMEGVCAFFQKSLNNPGSSKLEDITVLDAKELTVTPTGQVSTSFTDEETAFSLNKKEAEILMNKLASARESASHLDLVRRNAKQI
jgi:dienelactone hydrolase